MNDPSVIVYFVIAYILKYYLNVKYVVEVRFRGQNIAFETGHYLQKKMFSEICFISKLIIMRTKLQSLLLSFIHKCVVQANINYIYTLEWQIPAILHHLCTSVVSIDSIILKYSKAHVADDMHYQFYN